MSVDLLLESDSWGYMSVDLLGEGAEGVAEGLGGQVEQRLQEHLCLQRVEALALVWTPHHHHHHHHGERPYETIVNTYSSANRPLNRSMLLQHGYIFNK